MSDTNLPAKADERARKASTKRQERYRKKLARIAWEGTGVHICGGKGRCFWATPVTMENGGATGTKGPVTECRCKAGHPCKCEISMLKTIIAVGESEHGIVASRLLGAAFLDILRAERRGKTDDVRDARIKVLDLLLRAENERRKLDIRERKLAMDESSARPSGPTIVEYIRQRADAEDTDDTEESAS